VIAPKAPSNEVAQAGRWALAIALGFLVLGIPIVANLVRGLWRLVRAKGPPPGLWWGRSLVVGDDNRVSTSKVTALVWTYTLAAALLSFVVSRWLGHSEAFNAIKRQGLNAEYSVLIGGPLGAAILAKGIVSTQVANGSAAKAPATTPSPAQLVQNDNGDADLGDVQYLLFNAVALVFFYGEILHAPQLGIPTIPDVLLGLTSVSAVGYVGKKALSSPGGISAVQPMHAAVGERVTIATAGIIQAADDLPAITVKFGSTPASPGTLIATPTTSQGVLIEAAVPPDAAGQVAITVSAPTSKPATFDGFSIKPTIGRGQNIVAPRGETIEVHVSGVAGLGAQFRATVAGHSAPATVSGSGEVHLTIPANAPVGEGRLQIATPGGSDAAPIMVIDSPAAVARPAVNGARAAATAVADRGT
jgi:hypothetical protein